MESSPNKTEKSSQPPINPTSTVSSSKTNLNAASSTSKIVIITPDQIAKLGLTQRIQTVLDSHVTTPIPSKKSVVSKINVSDLKSGVNPAKAEAPRKKNIIVSKITVINGKSSEDIRAIIAPKKVPDETNIPTVDLSEDDESSEEVEYIENPKQDVKSSPESSVKARKGHELTRLESISELQSNAANKVRPNILKKCMNKSETLKKSSLNYIPTLAEKHKIHVLSNQQISLPDTYIKQLKSNKPEKLVMAKDKSYSSSVYIYNTGSAEKDCVSEPEIDCESKEEIILVGDEFELSESAHNVTSNAQEKDVELQEIISESTKIANSKPVEKPNDAKTVVSEETLKGKQNSQVIDLTDGGEDDVIKTEATVASNCNTITVKNETNTNSKPTTSELKKTTIYSNAQDKYKTKAQIIKVFAAKIKNKLDNSAIVEEPASLKLKEKMRSKINSALTGNLELISGSDAKKTIIVVQESNSSLVNDNNDVKFNNCSLTKTYSRKNNYSFNQEDSHPNPIPEKIKIVTTPTPKKRGRKKNSEIIVLHSDDDETPIETWKPVSRKRGRKKKEQQKEEVEDRSSSPEQEVIRSRSGRKRKAVNYLALAEGKDFEDDDLEVKSKRVRARASSASECSDANEVSQDAKPKEDVPKRKRGRPRKVPLKNEEMADSSISEVESKVAKISGETSVGDASSEEANISQETTDTSMSSTMEAAAINTDTMNITTEESTKTAVTCKARKGRPPRVKTATQTVLTSIFQNSLCEQSEKDEDGGEQIADNAETVQLSEEINNVESTPDSTKKKPGKKKRTRHSKSQSDQNESYTGSTVTCSICNKELTRVTWPNHKLRCHNNLAWKVGDPPLDLNDQKLVINILTDIYKRKKPLYCEMCGQSKKSVVGFLSHKSVCRKSTEELSSVRVKCEFCDRTVLPVSMAAHLRFCKGTEQGRENSENGRTQRMQKNNEDSPLQDRRRAATKAANLIQSLKEGDTAGTNEKKVKNHRMWYFNYDFRPTYFGKKRFQSELLKDGVIKCRFEGCAFEATNVDAIFEHLFACAKQPSEGYTCKFCIITYKTKEDVAAHMQQAHVKPEECSEEEEPDGEEFDEDEFFDEDVDDTDKGITCNKIKPAISNKLNCEYKTENV